jgi:hypothetical protein
MYLIFREAIENELHPYSINREGSFCLSKLWMPHICSLKTFETWPRFTWRHSSISLFLLSKQPHHHPFHQSLESDCILAIYKPMPLPASPPPPLCILNLVVYTNAPILT